MESILTSIKMDLGLTEEQTHFDTQILACINSTLMTLNQIGIGPEEGFSISGKFDTWEQFLGSTMPYLEGVKTYVYYRVKLDFDPPQSAAQIAAMERAADRLEWRLTTQAELIKDKEV